MGGNWRTIEYECENKGVHDIISGNRKTFTAKLFWLKKMIARCDYFSRVFAVYLIRPPYFVAYFSRK